MPILDAANIKNTKPHTFRHTFASHLVIMGVSIYVVKELLRHASVKETEVYAHLSRESTRTAVKKLSIASLKTPAAEVDTSAQPCQLTVEIKRHPPL
jgi:integrase